MKTAVVSRKSWGDCFREAYNETPETKKHLVATLLFEQYGIEHWTKIDPYTVQLRYTDDEKMIQWMLRWL
jgi:hypothetical protein